MILEIELFHLAQMCFITSACAEYNFVLHNFIEFHGIERFVRLPYSVKRLIFKTKEIVTITVVEIFFRAYSLTFGYIVGSVVGRQTVLLEEKQSLNEEVYISI